MMTIQISETEIADEVAYGGKAADGDGPAVDRRNRASVQRKPGARTELASGKSGGRHDKKSKKDQLLTLLSKPNGTRISVIAERLGWQPHTVRAALSGLRKQGIGIKAAKSQKTGETVYSIVAGQNGEDAGREEVAP
ncbi:DUF3489 domain-containing protein [Breoghania sp.]|uniref:DUF3489 domain-containing protein n=1 Tax=Breoghania sp. TaxID=2065378 RepID=UPI002AA9478E|nr:DUF3489 domain-containing protein [Breoghania sp.]